MSVFLCSKILILIYFLKYIIWDFRKLYFYNIKSFFYLIFMRKWMDIEG